MLSIATSNLQSPPNALITHNENGSDTIMSFRENVQLGPFRNNL